MTESSAIAPTSRKRAAHDDTPSAPPTRRVASTRAAARHVGMAEITLRKLRVSGQGPQYIKLSSRMIGYLYEDLDAWLSSRPRCKSTSEHKADIRLAAPHRPSAA